MYKGADNSLARPGRKQSTFPTFYGTWEFNLLTPNDDYIGHTAPLTSKR